MRYYFIRDLINQCYQQSTELPNQVGNGLNGEATRSYTNQYVFFPSDPNELVDQLKQLFEKLGGNDSFYSINKS